MILKNLLFNLFIGISLANYDCSYFYDSSNQNNFVQLIEKPKYLIKTIGDYMQYSLEENKYPKLSKYYYMVVQVIRNKDDMRITRNYAKFNKKFYQIDQFAKFFPSYCSYFEQEILNQQKAYYIVEKGGLYLSELIKKGGARLLTFIEKFAVMKKIAKTVTIFHLYDFQLCDLDSDSFQVFIEDKLYDDELLSDQFQAQNLKYVKFQSLIEEQEKNNCPISQKIKGNEAPEQIQRQILFDDIEKKYKQRSDIYQMAFLFLQLFQTNQEYDDLKTLAQSRTVKNLKDINIQIIQIVTEFLDQVKQTQIDKQYQKSFEYFKQMIIRMFQFNPSDRFTAYDIFQGLLLVISNDITDNQLEKIKTTANIKAIAQTEANKYPEDQENEMIMAKQPYNELTKSIYASANQEQVKRQQKDDIDIAYNMKKPSQFEKIEEKQSKRQMSV